MLPMSLDALGCSQQCCMFCTWCMLSTHTHLLTLLRHVVIACVDAGNDVCNSIHCITTTWLLTERVCACVCVCGLDIMHFDWIVHTYKLRKAWGGGQDRGWCLHPKCILQCLCFEININISTVLILSPLSSRLYVWKSVIHRINGHTLPY